MYLETLKCIIAPAVQDYDKSILFLILRANHFSFQPKALSTLMSKLMSAHQESNQSICQSVKYLLIMVISRTALEISGQRRRVMVQGQDQGLSMEYSVHPQHPIPSLPRTFSSHGSCNCAKNESTLSPFFFFFFFSFHMEVSYFEEPRLVLTVITSMELLA